MAIRLINHNPQVRVQQRNNAIIQKLLLALAVLVAFVLIQVGSIHNARIRLSSSFGWNQDKTAVNSGHNTNINDRLLLHHPNANSSVLQYCNSSLISEDGCWEPSDLQGAWVLHNDTSMRNNQNKCPGWDFGKVCENGYARNVECKGFVDEYRWESVSYVAHRDENRLKRPVINHFDPQHACRLLGPNRTILMVGDSTMGQAASEMINELLPGHCQQQVEVVLSDTLVKRYFGIPGVGGMNRGPHWSIPIKRLTTKEKKDTIVIYSIGPHIYGEENFRDVFEETLHYAVKMEQTHPNLQFIYKTSNTPGCSRSISQLSPDQTGRVWSQEGGFTHQHDKFYGRDLYTIGRLQSLGRPFLDLRMLYGRVDAHPGSLQYVPGRPKQDCLHHCTPGPLRIVAHLFYDILRNGL